MDMLQDTNLPVLDIDEDFVDTTALVYVEPRADCTLSHWIEQCIASERGLPDESLLQVSTGWRGGGENRD